MRSLQLLTLCVAGSLILLSACGDSDSQDQGCDASCEVDGHELSQGEFIELSGDDGCQRCVCNERGSLTCANIVCSAGDDARDASDDSGDAPSDADDSAGPSDTADDEISQPLVPGPLPSGLCPCREDGDVTAGNLAAAIGVCGDTVLSANYSGDRSQFGIVSDYFGILGRRGNCLAVISTGRADEVPETGTMFNPKGPQPGTDFERTSPDPRPQGGGGMVNDLAQLTLELKRPAMAEGIEFDFMFLSSEWPEYLCVSYNDTYLTILESEENEGGRPINISFDGNNNEVSVNVGFFENPIDWSTDLRATPFGITPLDFGSSFPGFPTADKCPAFADRAGCTLPSYCADGSNLNYNGSGTGWLTSRAPISTSEETIKITFSIHDEGDGVYDSLVLIDGFRWLNYPPTIGTGKF